MHSASLRYYYHLDLYYSFAKQRQSIIHLSFERGMTNSYFKVKCFSKNRIWSMHFKGPNELFNCSSNQHIWTKEMITFHSPFSPLEISMLCVILYLENLDLSFNAGLVNQKQLCTSWRNGNLRRIGASKLGNWQRFTECLTWVDGWMDDR